MKSKCVWGLVAIPKRVNPQQEHLHLKRMLPPHSGNASESVPAGMGAKLCQCVSQDDVSLLIPNTNWLDTAAGDCMHLAGPYEHA